RADGPRPAPRFLRWRRPASTWLRYRWPTPVAGLTANGRSELSRLLNSSFARFGAALSALGLSAAVVVGVSGAASVASLAAVSVSPASTPAFSDPGCPPRSPAYNFSGSGDAADPQVIYSGGHYYAFS